MLWNAQDVHCRSDLTSHEVYTFCYKGKGDCKNLKDFVLGFLKNCYKNQGLNVTEKHLSGLQNSDTVRLHQFKENACKTLFTFLLMCLFFPPLPVFAHLLFTLFLRI